MLAGVGGKGGSRSPWHGLSSRRNFAMRVEAHHTLEQLQVHARSEQRPTVALRIRLVIWALQKRSATEIAQLSESIVAAGSRTRIRRYNREGVGGTREPTRTVVCDPSAAEQNPLEGAFGRRPHVRRFGLHVAGQRSYNAFSPRNSASCVAWRQSSPVAPAEAIRVRPRPQHRQADPAAQEDFKKVSPADRGDSSTIFPIERYEILLPG